MDDTAPNIPQDEEKGGQLLAILRDKMKELVRGEVVASLLSQDWLKDKKILSHLNAAVERKISNGLSSLVEKVIHI